MDRVSSCDIYVNQPNTQRFVIEFIHNNRITSGRI